MDAIDNSVVKKIIIESAQNKFDDARIAHQIRHGYLALGNEMHVSAVRRACAASDSFNWAANAGIVAAEGYALHGSNVKMSFGSQQYRRRLVK